MSTPRSLALHESIRRAETATERGSFVTWLCEPRGTSLPHGHVLLIPGFTGSKEDFALLLPLLAASGWSAATYDQRGQFETEGSTADDYSLDGYAADALAVSRALFGEGERVHVVGHSFGGLVAATATVSRPDAYASLTLMCSGPGAIEGDRGTSANAAGELIDADGLDAAWSAKQRDDADRGVEPVEPDIQEFLHRRFLSNAPESLAAMARHLGSAADRTQDLVAVDVPTAVLRGEDDDAWPHEAQNALATALGTRVVVVSGAAHSPAVEQPESTRDALVRIWLS